MKNEIIKSALGGDGASKTIKIVVADDHPLFLKGLKDTLADEPDFEIIGSAVNGAEALQMIIDLQPHIAILDMDMPLMNGIEVAKILIKEHKHIKTIILSMHKDPDITKASMALGINGYVFKDDAVNDLVRAIRKVLVEPNFVTSSNNNISKYDDENSNQGIKNLTSTEKNILKEIASQKTTKQIADAHFISVKTAENHRNNISKKLNLSGSNSLLKFAISVKDLL